MGSSWARQFPAHQHHLEGLGKRRSPGRTCGSNLAGVGEQAKLQGCNSQVMLMVRDEARTLGSTAATGGTRSFGLLTSLTLTHSFNNPCRAWAPHRAAVERPGCRAGHENRHLSSASGCFAPTPRRETEAATRARRPRSRTKSGGAGIRTPTVSPTSVPPAPEFRTRLLPWPWGLRDQRPSERRNPARPAGRSAGVCGERPARARWSFALPRPAPPAAGRGGAARRTGGRARACARARGASARERRQDRGSRSRHSNAGAVAKW